jgi:alpha-L-rhamnosidase
MDSVKLNNTLQEDWTALPDSNQQWSHCAVVPLYTAMQGLAGIRPLAPGFVRAELRPQLADIATLELTAQTVRGPLRFVARGEVGNRELTLEPPPGCQAELVLRREEVMDLPRAEGEAPAGHVRYVLPAKQVILKLKYT